MQKIPHTIAYLALLTLLSVSAYGATTVGRAATAGTTYYVDRHAGADRNSGLTRDTAFRTLRRAVAALDRSGGDTLVVRGTFRETLNLMNINNPRDGKPDLRRRTIIRGDVAPDGNRVPAVIDGGIPPTAASFPFDCQGKQPGFGPGTDNRYLDRGIILTQCNAITVDGLTVQGVAGLGVLTWRSSHIVLRNVTVQFTAQSALMLSHGKFNDPMVHDLTVEYCRVNQSNLGRWRDQHNATPGRRGYEMRSETVSIVRWDGFHVHHNHISNSLMEGIDFKEGSCNGEIDHNIVEQCRSAGIYANEGRDTTIHHNVVRRIGYYDPETGAGLIRGGAYLTQKIPGSTVGEPGATAILISTGDLNGPGRPPLEVGRVSGIEVYHNVIYWTRKAAISVWNQWRKERRGGWVIKDIRIDNNTCFKTCLGPNPVSAVIIFDAGATNIKIRNNIICGSEKFDLEMWDRPDWPRPPAPPQRTVTHNLFNNNARHHTWGDHPIRSDPMFVELPEELGDDGNFTLTAGSPARRAAIATDDTSAGSDIGAIAFGKPIWQAGCAHDSK